MYLNQKDGWVEVICGPMFAGKTEELLRRVRRLEYAKKNILVFKPKIDVRYKNDCVVSHDHNQINAIQIEKAKEIFNYVNEDTNVVAIDEIQFLDEEVVDVVKLIFRLALNNNGVVKIVQELNRRGIDTPSIYKAKNGDKRCLTSIEQRKSKFTYDEINKWNTKSVGKILRDIVYIGDMEIINMKLKTIKLRKEKEYLKKNTL